MAFSEFELKLIEKQVGMYVRNRTNPKIKDQLRFEYRIEKQSVFLIVL